MGAALQGLKWLFFKPKEEPKVEEPAPKNISEPVLTICKLMEENPRRFKVIKHDRYGIIIKDSVTDINYVTSRKDWAYEGRHVLVSPNCFSQDEDIALGQAVFSLTMLKRELVGTILSKRCKRVRDKERNRLMSLYCNTPD